MWNVCSSMQRGQGYRQRETVAGGAVYELGRQQSRENNSKHIQSAAQWAKQHWTGSENASMIEMESVGRKTKENVLL